MADQKPGDVTRSQDALLAKLVALPEGEALYFAGTTNRSLALALESLGLATIQWIDSKASRGRWSVAATAAGRAAKGAAPPVELSETQEELLTLLVALPPGCMLGPDIGVGRITLTVAAALERKGFAVVVRTSPSLWTVAATDEGRAYKASRTPPAPPPGFVSGTLTYCPDDPLLTAAIDGVPLVSIIGDIARKHGLSYAEAGSRVGTELAEALMAGAKKSEGS